MRYLFFFSSRRRHTRLQGDWSSDVCSSDLTPSLTRVSIATGAICACAPPSPASRAEAKPEARGTAADANEAGTVNRLLRALSGEIGRAAGRGRGESSVGAGSLKKKKKEKT